MNNKKTRVAITHGDPNGIGYETILKLIDDPRIADLCTIIVYGSSKIASFYRKGLGPAQTQLKRIDSAAEAHDGAYNIINVIGEDFKIEPGTATESGGKAALAALEAAVADLKKGEVDVLVTAPINKHAIQSDEFRFPGHTEYLQEALCEPGSGAEALMMLCSDDMRVALTTTHLPIAKVPEAITKELVLSKIEALNASLKKDFGLERPRIAVLGLNPHAGEQGLLGTEETEAITPAIEEARNKRILAFGPYPADGFFGSEGYKAFDGILAMYHDQGLAPFKTLAMSSGVNFTAGLPYVRTSPDHGTGYDIAGQDKASADSLRQAVYMAIDVFRRRGSDEE